MGLQRVGNDRASFTTKITANLELERDLDVENNSRDKGEPGKNKQTNLNINKFTKRSTGIIHTFQASFPDHIPIVFY